MQRLGDDLLGDVRAVGVGRVDEVDAQAHGFADDLPRRLTIRRLAPHPGAHDAHGAEAEAVDFQVPDREGAGGLDDAHG
jgi:hypothetical protein